MEKMESISSYHSSPLKMALKRGVNVVLITLWGNSLSLASLRELTNKGFARSSLEEYA